jgi:predicted metal-dependent phosphotriesterase family hydrolase
MANWAKKLKRSVQQLLEGGDWGYKEQYRKMEKSKVIDKLAPAVRTKKHIDEMKAAGKSKEEIETVTGVNTDRTNDTIKRLKQAGLTDAEIKKLRG